MPATARGTRKTSKGFLGCCERRCEGWGRGPTLETGNKMQFPNGPSILIDLLAIPEDAQGVSIPLHPCADPGAALNPKKRSHSSSA